MSRPLRSSSVITISVAPVACASISLRRTSSWRGPHSTFAGSFAREKSSPSRRGAVSPPIPARGFPTPASTSRASTSGTRRCMP